MPRNGGGGGGAGTYAQFLAERSRLMSNGFRCVVRYAPPSVISESHSLLVRDKRRRRDNEAVEHEIAHEDHAVREKVSDYWQVLGAPGNGWDRHLPDSGPDTRRAAVIPALWGAYEQHWFGTADLIAPQSNVIFNLPTNGGDHVS